MEKRHGGTVVPIKHDPGELKQKKINEDKLPQLAGDLSPNQDKLLTARLLLLTRGRPPWYFYLEEVGFPAKFSPISGSDLRIKTHSEQRYRLDSRSDGVLFDGWLAPQTTVFIRSRGLTYP